ncbi:hypothetical protein PG995_010238 [Apiospora arundinis]|uniref:Uncharacterized protein n=1 Tax=Apiospora arundinis TaxID=335852 RepID=A0ABR2ITE0_9PEZI
MKRPRQKQLRPHEPAKVKEEEGDHVLVGLIPALSQGQTPKSRSDGFHRLLATTPDPSSPSPTSQKGENGFGSSHKGLLPLTPKSIEPRPRSNLLTETSPITVRPIKEFAIGEETHQYLQDDVRASIEIDNSPDNVHESKVYTPGKQHLKAENESIITHRGNQMEEHTGVKKRKFDLQDNEAQDRSQKQARHFSGLHGHRGRESSSGDSAPEDQNDEEEDEDGKAESDLEADHEANDSDYDALDHWRREQIVLNAVLKGRDEFSLLPSTWRVHFLGAPVSDYMFYRQTKGMAARPRIYAHEDRFEVRGARHLRNFIEVASRIRDLRTKQAKVAGDKRWTDAEKHSKNRNITQDMSRRLHKLLSDAIQWSWADGNLTAYKDDLLPNIEIMETSGSSEPSSVEVEGQMARLAERWRQRFAKGDFESLPSQPQVPVIYGFVIVGWSLVIVSQDAANPEAHTHTPLKINMAEDCQEGWNALGIMVTICWARDMLMRLRDELGLTVRNSEAESDPDA